MKTQVITIRVATTADAITIAEFSRMTFYETFAPYNSIENMEIFMREQFTKEALISEVSHPTSIFFLAYSGPALVGYVRLREGETPKELKGLNAMEVARIYSAPEMIGKGIGNLLMQHSIDTAIQKKKGVIWLSVWSENDRAIKFYIKWGFQKFGEQIFILGKDLQKEWLVKKSL